MHWYQWTFSKTDYDAKIKDVEGKIPSITGLATTATLTVVKNMIQDVNDLVKEIDYNERIKDIDWGYMFYHVWLS